MPQSYITDLLRSSSSTCTARVQTTSQVSVCDVLLFLKLDDCTHISIGFLWYFSPYSLNIASLVYPHVKTLTTMMILPLFSFAAFGCSFFSLLAFTLALDHPPANDVTWLYPSDYTQNLTFNTLDIVNVSWISAYAPTFLNLACQHTTDDGYSSALKIQVPATGNRLVSLISAASYRNCHFEISAPANFTNISHSPSFDMTALDEQQPGFFTLDHGVANAQQRNNGGASSNAGSCTNNPRQKYAMIGIGVGVAVGVFAITTAAYTLLSIARRTKRLRQQQERKGSDSRTKEWVLNRSPSSGSSRVPVAEKDCVVTKEWMEKQIRNGDFYEVGAGCGRSCEVESQRVGELESRGVGCAG